MSDVHSPEFRSYNMSMIHGKDTKPEERVRKYLFSQGFRYRKNDPRLPGKPDILLPKYKTVVFINGCFWHMHENCKYFSCPKSNVNFWKDKITKNAERDSKKQLELQQLGWNVIVIWECQLKGERFRQTMFELVEKIRKND